MCRFKNISIFRTVNNNSISKYIIQCKQLLGDNPQDLAGYLGISYKCHQTAFVKSPRFRSVAPTEARILRVDFQLQLRKNKRLSLLEKITPMILHTRLDDMSH